ncbi:MAG: hypothetical protein KF841_07435 [Phycisphaerae bacterium]|nr:hypothetical protein [Phycisphaerae bacterium]
MNWLAVTFTLLLLNQDPVAAAKPADGTEQKIVNSAESVTIELRPGSSTSTESAPRFTARFAPETLAAILEQTDAPLPVRLGNERAAMHAAVEKVNMTALLDEMLPYLTTNFADKFVPDRDVIIRVVPESRQIAVDAADLFAKPYIGPQHEVIGFLVHDVTEAEYRAAALRTIHRARQILEGGDPGMDRTTPEYWKWLADQELNQIRDARRRGDLAEVEKKEIRQRIAKSLGLADGGDPATAPNWLKESRRFSYIIRNGEFIERLRPLVQRINREMEIAGFAAPAGLDRSGIYFDPDIGDVDIVLPRDMLIEFLSAADEFERRMAEDAIISIEAVRLTDREIVEGAIASRVSAQVQGVHDAKRFKRSSVFRELGLNSLLAVANQQLTVQTLSGVAAGTLPAGTPPITIAPPTLPPIRVGTEVTTLGSTFSVGADDVFFDGREQVTGFSYIGPDGIAHTLTTEVVDSMRELWERIERNLIVHKIKKTGTLTEFSVPVGPNTRTYKGIAALISQENQQLIVATGTGAISEIKATAGTWLVVEDFVIAPIPGSSTTLTREEKEEFRLKVLLTMFLRDPFVSPDIKRDLLSMSSRTALQARLDDLIEERGSKFLRPSDPRRTYAIVFAERLRTTLGDKEFEKKEQNSTITLTFFSSQGNIVQSPGTTQLGDANDLTSFTTVLSPNNVTPISSFFTKSGNGLEGSSILTDMERGERQNSEKSMTHLLIRSRFPTRERELSDRVEGRNLGYYELPLQKRPSSDVDVPFLSSSEHPCERLAKLRFGLSFPVLDPTRVKRPFNRVNPNRFPGDISPKAWETATTRMLMNRRMIADAGGARKGLQTDFVSRFVTEVRSLLEYDEDFFPAPSVSLRNMGHWNDADRIITALNNSPSRFALDQLVKIVDELGAELIPDEYANQYLAYSPSVGWFQRRRLYPLTEEMIWHIRRDAAIHFLRFREAYGDSFLEAVSTILKLGTYRSTDNHILTTGPLRGYRDLVLFDQSGSIHSDPELYKAAYDSFLFLKDGGYVGRMFEKSRVELEDLPKSHRALMFRGEEILSTVEYDAHYHR